MSIKAKQVAGVTTLVVLVVAGMTAVQMASLTRVRIEETASRAAQLKDAILHRTGEVVRAGHPDPYLALREDGGLRSILNSAVTNQPETNTMLYAAVVDTEGRAVAHSIPTAEGSVLPVLEDLIVFKDASSLEQVTGVLEERRFELREQILLGDKDFGAIRIAASTFLIRNEILRTLQQFGYTAAAALAISTMVAMLLAQWMLRPIHVIQSGLSRLGRGELDVRLDLPGQEFADLGSSFEAVSAQLAAVRAPASLPASTSTEFESVMENLEDAVGLFSAEGELMFCNSALRALLPEIGPREAAAKATLSMLAADHPLRQLVERALAGRQSAGPIAVPLGTAEGDQEAPEYLLLCHAIEDARGKFLGAMIVARNLGYLSHVHTTLNYSRKLAALGRLMAGVAHEVKNPLNAMTIHLELLKQKLSSMREPITVPAGPSGGVADARSDEARQRHRGRDQAARPGRGRVPQVRPARRAEAAARAPGIARQRSHIDDGSRRRAPEHRRPGGVPAERARDQRRPGDAAAGAAEPDDQRVPRDAGRGNAEADLPGGVAAARGNYGGGYRGRHPAREPGPDFRPVLHDQGEGERYRPVDGVPNRAVARRRG